MTEITSENFEDNYSEIIKNLESSNFVSIDCEFSGLFIDTFSLFDTPCIRYNKLQNEMKDFLIIQFGLTTFRFNSDKNQYVSSTYSFYLKPSTFFDKNLKFSCGVQSMEYLYENNFDFKKVITKGISYVNLADTKKIFNLLRDSQYNEQFSDKILPYFNKVREWITSNEDSKELILEVKSFVEADLFHLHVTIRRQFCNVWTYYCSPKSIKVMKVSKSEKKNLEKETSLEEKILDSILGFSKIMREIKNLQKPLIGHNCLVDLMMIYKQFYNPDPVSYKVFKKSILKIFPKIFDTKYLVKQLNSTLPKEYTSTPKSLADLYFFCKSSQKSKKVPFSPLISPKEESVWNGHFHDAGFDSFCTGYCFLKMAFMFFCWNEVDKKFRVTTMTSSVSLLSSVDCFNNRLYSANGLSGIILNGEDTKMEIRTIYIKSKTKEALDIKKISEIIAKYSFVDMKLLNPFHAVIAVRHKRDFDEIIESLEKNQFYLKNNFIFPFLGNDIVPFGIIASTTLTIIVGIFYLKNFL